MTCRAASPSEYCIALDVLFNGGRGCVIIFVVRLNVDRAESLNVGRGVNHRILDIFVP